MKYLIIDSRMREIEKKKLKELGYELIEIPENKKLYYEISSHVDIFVCKINNQLVIEKSLYETIKNVVKCDRIHEGSSLIGYEYPDDIKYNLCLINNKAFHNFKYTDSKIIEILNEEKIEQINVKQGYTNCSIFNFADFAITADKGLKKVLDNEKIENLFLNYVPDIKLYSKDGYSLKNGFIGGAISKIGNKIIVFGDLEKIDKNDTIRNFIKSKNIDLIEFKGYDVIDYGGLIEIED